MFKIHFTVYFMFRLLFGLKKLFKYGIFKSDTSSKNLIPTTILPAYRNTGYRVVNPGTVA
jgi:hypothetical protein